MKHSGLGGDSGRDPPLTGPDCRECSPTVLARMAGEKRIVSFRLSQVFQLCVCLGRFAWVDDRLTNPDL